MFIYNYILAIYEFLVVVENFIFSRGILGYLIFSRVLYWYVRTIFVFEMKKHRQIEVFLQTG